MKRRDFRVYLQEIYDAIGEIEDFTHGFSLDEFRNDKLRIKGVFADLIIIGEAVDKLPKHVKHGNRQIPWRTWMRMKETRNKLAHEYYNATPESLWAIAISELPSIKPIIKKMIESSE
jgi:uncharacterized protein with HEPN domain